MIKRELKEEIRRVAFLSFSKGLEIFIYKINKITGK
jgi:hypothetical protein